MGQIEDEAAAAQEELRNQQAQIAADIEQKKQEAEALARQQEAGALAQIQNQEVTY